MAARLAGVGRAALHHRLEAGHFRQAALRTVGQAAEDAADRLEVVGGDQQVSRQGVDGPSPVSGPAADRRRACLARSARPREVALRWRAAARKWRPRAPSMFNALLGALLEQIGPSPLASIAWAWFEMAGHVDQQAVAASPACGSIIRPTPTSPPGTPLRSSSVEPSRSCRLAQCSSHLLAKVLAERLPSTGSSIKLPNWVFFHWAFSGINVGDRQKADRRPWAGAFAGAGGPGRRATSQWSTIHRQPRAQIQFASVAQQYSFQWVRADTSVARKWHRKIDPREKPKFSRPKRLTPERFAKLGKHDGVCRSWIARGAV